MFDTMNALHENPPAISFAMLGPASSGKTVAACSLYHMMSGEHSIHIGENKYSVAASPSDTIDLEEIYNTIETNGTFPEGSTENKTYTLRFRANRKTVCKVVWLDYRGYMLFEGSFESNTKEYNELIEQLQLAGVLVVLVDGVLLDSYIRIEKHSVHGTEEAALKKKIRTVLKVYSSLLEDISTDEDNEDLSKPVIFMVTKSDLVQAASDDEMMKYLQEMLDAYDLIEGHKAILSQCTLGQELAYNSDSNSIDNLDTLAPEGFELPLLLTVGYRFSKDGQKYEERTRKKIEARIEAAENTINNYDEIIRTIDNRGFFGRLFHVFSDKKAMSNAKSGKAEARRNVQNLNAELAQLQNNAYRTIVGDLLTYIESENVIYLNEDGEECPLENFFE